METTFPSIFNINIVLWLTYSMATSITEAAGWMVVLCEKALCKTFSKFLRKTLTLESLF